MARTSGMPVGADVRERLRAAQRAETNAIGNVQKAVAVEANSCQRLDKVILKLEAEREGVDGQGAAPSPDVRGHQLRALTAIVLNPSHNSRESVSTAHLAVDARRT